MKKLYYFLAGLAVAVTGFAYMAQAAPITPVTGGGTGTSTIPANGAILIGNGTGYQFVQSSTFGGSGGGVASTSPFTVGNLVVVSSSGALASISSGTYISTNTGNWAGTWQGVNSSTFYLASNPSGYITTSTFNATGTAFYFPYWNTAGNALSPTSSISIATSTGYICMGCTGSTNALSVDQNNGADENLWVQNFSNGNAVFVTANASSNYSAFNVYGTGQQWRFGQNGSTAFTLSNITGGTTPITVSTGGLTTLSLGATLNGTTTLGSTTNALVSASAGGVLSAYAATSCGAGTAFTGLSATGTPTCTSYAPSTTIPTAYVSSFNGSTGAVTGISSINNGTGTYTIVSGTNITISTTTTSTIINSTASGNLLVTPTSSVLANNVVAFKSAASSTVDATTSIYTLSNGDTSIGSSTDNGLLSVVNASNTIALQVASTTNNSTTVNIIGLPMFLGSSTVITPSISGAIVGLGCDTATSSVDSSITSSTAAFITTPETFPGAGLFWQTYLSATGVITTEVCSDVSATPTASQYVVKIIK